MSWHQLFLYVDFANGSCRVWSLAIGSLPQGSYFPNLPPKPVIISDKEATLWVPYTDDGKLVIELSYFPSQSAASRGN